MSKFLIYCAVYVFLERDGHVYLMRRANTGYRNGMYSLPAGHVEAGETLLEAMCRELVEETGLTVPPEALALKHAMFRRTTDRTYADYYYVCRAFKGEPRVMEPEKCDEGRWMDAGALPKEVVPEIRHAWACMARGEAFSDISVDAYNVLDGNKA